MLMYGPTKFIRLRAGTWHPAACRAASAGGRKGDVEGSLRVCGWNSSLSAETPNISTFGNPRGFGGAAQTTQACSCPHSHIDI